MCDLSIRQHKTGSENLITIGSFFCWKIRKNGWIAWKICLYSKLLRFFGHEYWARWFRRFFVSEWVSRLSGMLSNINSSSNDPNRILLLGSLFHTSPSQQKHVGSDNRRAFCRLSFVLTSKKLLIFSLLWIYIFLCFIFACGVKLYVCVFIFTKFPVYTNLDVHISIQRLSGRNRCLAIRPPIVLFFVLWFPVLLIFLVYNKEKYQ